MLAGEGADFSRRSCGATVRTRTERLRPARAFHRFGDPLCCLAQSEVGKKLFECESARDARSAATGAAIAVLPRAASIFECEHGGGGGETQPRSCFGRPVD